MMRRASGKAALRSYDNQDVRDRQKDALLMVESGGKRQI
jgi:hypothetical protein